jgi:hypothetical protein
MPHLPSPGMALSTLPRIVWHQIRGELLGLFTSNYRHRVIGRSGSDALRWQPARAHPERGNVVQSGL